MRAAAGKALALLTARQRRRAAAVLAMVLAMALLDTAGVASVMPFLAVLGNPGTIESNPFLAWLYRRGGFGSADRFLMAAGGAAFLLVLASSGVRILTHHAINRFSEGCVHSLGSRLLGTYLRQPWTFFLDRNTAHLSATVLSEVELAVSRVIQPALHLLAYGLTVLALVAVLFAVDPVLAAAVTAFVAAVYGAVYLGFRGLLARMGAGRGRANRERLKAMSEAFGGIKELKVLARERAYLGRFDRASGRMARYGSVAATIAVAPRYLVEAIGIGGVLALALVLAGTRQDLGSVLPLLGLYAFAAYRLLPAAQHIYAAATALRYGLPALDAVHGDLFGAPPAEAVEEEVGVVAQDEAGRTRPVGQEGSPLEREAPARTGGEAEPQPSPQPSGRDVRLEGVGFRYPGAEGWALRGVDLTLVRGASVGVVGETGAGKTTLVDLVLGLLEPSEGRIVAGGIPLAGEALRRWQRSVGYVPQAVYLADCTVAENIALGVEPHDIDPQAVERAARAACLHDFVVRELPARYATEVGECGVRLSGGQRQRIGIARALYHGPAFLVLDEGTSALDAETERRVLEAIHGVRPGMTVLIVSHRPGATARCERVVVLESGRVKAVGDAREILGHGGRAVG